MTTKLSISDRSSIILWLFSGCFLIFVMVVVGGITRLTGSGLSITKWEVVTGAIPPLNEAEWEHEFELYKQSPQFHKINAHFGLEEFKGIYWWEYIHRLLGRLIGLVFIIPFLYFLFTRKLDKPLILKCLFLFLLGGLQGFLGWYMVKSGLVDMPNVSHFRLALHLTTAFITFGFTFWYAVGLIHTEKIRSGPAEKKFYNLTIAVFAVTLIQIVFGAFVAGMKAGYVYNTWPMMGDQLIAESFYHAWDTMGWHALIDHISGVQVVHRYLAYIVFLAVLFLYWHGKKQSVTGNLKLSNGQLQALGIAAAFVVIQFLLGIFTLIYSVPLTLGVLHQAGAFFLFAGIIYLLHRLKWGPVAGNE